MVRLPWYSGEYISTLKSTHYSTERICIEKSIENSYSGEYGTGHRLSAPSAGASPPSAFGLKDEPLVEWMWTKPRHQPAGGACPDYWYHRRTACACLQRGLAKDFQPFSVRI